MGNIGKRERYYLMLLAIVLVVGLIYFFGIRNLGFKYDELVATRAQLQAQLDYYESLKTQNAETQTRINELKTDISAEEGRFLPYINTASIEQYVLKTFEDAGCPYLVSVTADDITPESVTLPDGTSATDSLLTKRIIVQYSTTDGFNMPEYNRSTRVIDENGEVNEAAFQSYVEQIAWHGADSITGYDEFVTALQTIEAANPDCIKINSIGVTAEGGYMLLNAEIDFYSVTFRSRVSEANTDAPYITWAGESNIDTEGGFIGRPFVVEDRNSEWFMVMMDDNDALQGSRPFATYYSRAIFEQAVRATGLESVLGSEANLTGVGGAEEPVEET